MELRRFEDSLWQPLQEFLQKCYPRSKFKADWNYFAWRFRNRPEGSSLDSYLLLLEDGKVAGQAGALRDRLWIGSRWHEVVWIVDLMVAPEHRNSLGAAQLVIAMKRLSPVVLVTGAGPHLRRFYESLGFRRVSVNRTLYLPLHPGKIGGKLGLGWCKSGLLSFADRVLPGLFRQLANVKTWAWSFRAVDSGDRVLRKLLSSLEGCMGITSPRYPATLRWKYEDRPYGRHELVLAEDRRGRARAFGALRWFDRKGENRWIDLADFLVAPGDRASIRALAWETVRRGGMDGADFVRFRCPRSVKRALGRFWLDRTRECVDEVFFWARDPVLGVEFSRGPFHLTGSVSDRTDFGSDEWGE